MKAVGTEQNKWILATIAALSAQVIFGFSFMFTKMALGHASPLTVIADRYIVAFLGLTVVMVVTKTKIKFHKNIWKLILMSVFQPLLYFIFETYGIRMTTSAFSSIMISMIPIVSMVSGIFFLKEIPSLMQYVFAVISVSGVVITTIVSNADGAVTLLGILLLMGAVCSAVGYNITSRKISTEFSVLERTYAMTAIGMAAFGVIALLENIHDPFKVISSFSSLNYTLSIFFLGIVSSIVAFMLLNYANTYLPVAKTTVFSNITTVVSVAAGMIFLNEKLSVEMVIAIVMIIFGVLGVQIMGTKKKSG